MIVTDHKALRSALEGNRSNKNYQSRLTRWVGSLLSYQFKIVHIPGKDMGIEDYLSREPTGEPWPKLVLDKKFVVTSIECFHRALDCLYSRLNDTDSLNRNDNFLEHSQQHKAEKQKTKSRHGCYSNQNSQKRAKLDRNDNRSVSRLANLNNALARNTLVNFSTKIQSVNLVKKKIEKNGERKLKIKKRSRTNRKLQVARRS